jgi:hypothetical protein
MASKVDRTLRGAMGVISYQLDLTNHEYRSQRARHSPLLRRRWRGSRGGRLRFRRFVFRLLLQAERLHLVRVIADLRDHLILGAEDGVINRARLQCAFLSVKHHTDCTLSPGRVCLCGRRLPTDYRSLTTDYPLEVAPPSAALNPADSSPRAPADSKRECKPSSCSHPCGPVIPARSECHIRSPAGASRRNGEECGR